MMKAPPPREASHRVLSVAGSGFCSTGTLACVCYAWNASALDTGRSACATFTSHDLFMRASSTASGFLSITVKQARTALKTLWCLEDSTHWRGVVLNLPLTARAKAARAFAISGESS